MSDRTDTARLSLQGLHCAFGAVQAVQDVSLDVAPGEIVCLLGPSGCGKTTTLRVAAGVERQQQGRVLVDGQVVSDGPVHNPPEARSIGLMFQDFALFPHLTVVENVAFGLKGRDRGSVAHDYLARVGLPGFEGKYPHMLSGGEQQRVALARALAPNPRVMLMDEPFSGLDNRLRDEVRDEALSILKAEGAAVLLVTHEPYEAMRMADRIALMRAGRIVQIGAPYEIYNAPVDREAAGFFSDINTVHGVVQNRQTQTPFGLFQAPGLVDEADVEIIVRPQHLKISDENPGNNAENGVPARGVVERARFIGAESLIEVRMDHDGGILRATVPHAFLPDQGTPVWLSMRRDCCFVFPCKAQSRVASPFAAE
ncbi:MAG: ABC transporter ATP-binding protein [Pseudomonadota bacterium]